MTVAQPDQPALASSQRPRHHVLKTALATLLADIPVHPLSLRFTDRELEERYRHELFVAYLPVMRLAMLLGFLLYQGFIVFDYFVVPQAITAAWIIRFGLIGPLLLGTLLFSFHPRFEDLHQGLFCVVAGSAGLGICALMALSPPPGNHLYSVGLIIVVIYGFHFIRVRFLYATAIAWLFFAAHLTQLTVVSTVEQAVLIGSLSLLATTNLVEMIVGYVQELYIRRDFLHQSRLADSEQRLRNIAANIPGSVFRCIRRSNSTFDVRYMSQGLRRVFDRSPETVMSTPEEWNRWLHPEDVRGWDELLRSFSDADTPVSHECRLIGDNGAMKWMRMNARSHRRANGDIVWDGIMLDITDLKAREAELQQAQKMEALGQLTGGVAHDFNNLLTVISGNLQLIAEDSEPDTETHEMADEALAAVDQGQALTRQLLAFARRQSLDPSSLDLSALVFGMTAMLRRTLGQGVDIRTSLPEGMPAILADRAHLQNAILNLALNAKDAMNGAGTLTLAVEAATLDAAYCEEHPDSVPGDYVMLAVSDSGCGMAPEVLEHVFEPFFTTKESGSGSGLGLSMIYGFVRQTRGHIHIYSEPGQGTTVRLYLPVAHEKPQDGFEPAGTAPQGQGELILLVEDNDGVRKLARRMLHDLGYRVREANSGPDALGKLDDSVDMLFTDMNMPGGMSGAELAEQARRTYPELQVLFATGYTEHSPAYEKFIECGALLLSKPYRKDLLASLVARTLAQRDTLT